MKCKNQCPFNCHELGQSKTKLDDDEIYKQQALIEENKYNPDTNSGLWLAQAIYEYQQDPRPELRIPSTKNQVQQAIYDTQALFDQIYIDWTDQSIKGYIKLPFDEQPLLLKYALKLTKSTNEKFNILQPKEILQQLIERFKEDLIKFFDMEDYIRQQIIEDVLKFDQINDQLQPDIDSNIFELGYTKYIKQVANQWICHEQPLSPYIFFYIDYTAISFKSAISLDHGLLAYYELHQISEIQLLQNQLGNDECSSTLEYATEAEFDKFFKDCN